MLELLKIYSRTTIEFSTRKTCGLWLINAEIRLLLILDGQFSMEDKYLYMIRQAQEFMNENHFADISRLHCLLRKMMPKEYHYLIDQIKEFLTGNGSVDYQNTDMYVKGI